MRLRLVHTGFPHPSQNEFPFLFPTYSWLDDPYSLPILHEIVWNIFYFTYKEYFKILDIRGYGFLTISVLSVVKYPIFCFNELSYIFSTPLKTKFPTFSWLFNPFPNLTWLCQPIPYLFKALKNWNLIHDFYMIFITYGNPVHNVTDFYQTGVYHVHRQNQMILSTECQCLKPHISEIYFVIFCDNFNIFKILINLYWNVIFITLYGTPYITIFM